LRNSAGHGGRPDIGRADFTFCENAEPRFRDVPIAVYKTEARPGEVTSVIPDEFDAERASRLITQHTTTTRARLG
jgi:hypothetical protein